MQRLSAPILVSVLVLAACPADSNNTTTSASEGSTTGTASEGSRSSAAGGTVTYIMLDWFANDGPSDEASGPPQAHVLPVVGPGYVGVTGSF